MAAAHAGGNFVEKRRCGLINFIKTPNPRCRLHGCLIEFIDWSGDTVSYVGIFDRLCELLPL